MTITSYSQNLEDVLLSRALREVEAGFYVDVGAADPTVNSVTKAFYDAGWSGLNIEPLTTFASRLTADRPRDITLNIGLGETAGELPFFEVEDNPELSTLVTEIAEQYIADGRRVSESAIPVRTLATVLAEHVPGEQDIHFLKVDVEGSESAVFAGADFARHRPWIVLVETVTYGRETSEEPQWAKDLGAAGYRRVFFDGLNEFYLAREHDSDLAASFLVPVNVRDDYVVATGDRARATLAEIASILGLESFSGEHEVVERTDALFRDRIQFEKRAVKAEKRANRAETAERALRTELSSSLQWLFERDRQIAWQAAQLARERETQRELQHALREDLANASAMSAQVLASTSWRVTLPLRFIRRPGLYFKAIRRR